MPRSDFRHNFAQVPSAMKARKKAPKRARRATKQLKPKPRRTQSRNAKPRGDNGISLETRLAELKQRLLEISDLRAANSLLSWDHATYMPQGGAAARGRQGATLGRLAHERSIDPALGRLLDQLEPYAEGLPYDSDDASLIRVARRDFEKKIKVTADYMARSNTLNSASYDAWTRARPANDFATMAPFLEQALELSLEYAEFFAPYEHVADPMIDDAEEGLTTTAVRALFDELRRGLTPIMRAIVEQTPIDNSCLRGSFAEGRQLDFNLAVADRLGYDRKRGRLDKTHHPFCTKFSIGDVRITTRIFETEIDQALFSTVHEAGHALYEQGVSTTLEGTTLASGTSAGVHESQSRLWENVVGRSRGFWGHFYPMLQKAFPDQLGAVPLETFHRAINKVERSLIRTDADEVTYNFHVMLRFELELALLEGRLRVKDLPEAWRAAMQDTLGLTPPDDRDGCLQDVHWFVDGIGGGFQSYTIGNILSAQFYAAAVRAHPDIPHQIERGEFGTLHAWLREHVYLHGRKFTPDELIERATGGPMSMRPYLAYLRGKYGELYQLPA
jgi:carboxypeptidase Taq